MNLVSDIAKKSFLVGISGLILGLVFLPLIIVGLIGMSVFIISFSIDAINTYKVKNTDTKIITEKLKICRNDYTIVDIETTGLSPQNYEIIELSALKIRNNEIVDKFSMLVNPKGKINKKISEYTGITNEMVENQPAINEVLLKFIEFAGDDVVVAHNSDFDLSFICRDARLNNINYVPFYIDTLELAKSTLTLGGYKLIDIAKHYKIEKLQEHRGLSDCELLFDCYSKMNKSMIKVRKFDVDYHINFNRINIDIDVNKIKQDCSADANNPLYSKVCVITGDIENLSRTEVMQKIANCGGINQENITKKTDVLIIGKNAGNTKINKANEKIEKGQNIQIINEAEFLKIIN